MKTTRLITLTFSLFVTANVFAQSSVWTGSSVSTTTSGNVAIQGGQIDLTMLPTDAGRNIAANSSVGSLNLLSGSHGGAGADGAYITLNALNNGGTGAGGSTYMVTVGPSTNGTFFVDEAPTGGVWNMSILNSGQVAIGSGLVTGAIPMPSGYLLYVQQGILTEKLKVANSSDPTNWSDFVFDNNYKLNSLSYVADYIKNNKHLPEIPSAKEIAKDGIDVADMDAKLLQKIEELTLYVIKLQNEVDELKKKH